MVKFQRFVWALAGVVVAVMLWSTPVLPGWTADLSANSTTEQPAILVGPKEDAPIPLYLRPAANQPNVGYGMSGAAVTVLERVASFLPEADQDAAWNHIRLEDTPYTEGWVQGRFLSVSQTDELKTDE